MEFSIKLTEHNVRLIVLFNKINWYIDQQFKFKTNIIIHCSTLLPTSIDGWMDARKTY